MTRDKEQYFTPENFTVALLQHVSISGRVIEPSSGDGSVASVLEEYECNVITNDIDTNMPSHFHGDATEIATWDSMCEEDYPDWVVTNPPFSRAAEIMKHGYARAKTGLALLLRLSFLEPCEGRDKWLALNPPSRIIVLPRYSFTQDGKSDSVTCAWFVWFKDPKDRPTSKPIRVVPREWIGMVRKKKA